MINPSDVINYNRNERDLQEFLLFCISVAGKTAKRQAKYLNDFLSFSDQELPFDTIRKYINSGTLMSNLKKSKIGQYQKLCRAFTELINSNINIKTCSLEELEKIYGIGPKTARYFLLYSRPEQKYAVLDTHILKWIKNNLKINIPKNISKKHYIIIEQEFLSFAQKHELNIAELDLGIWNSLSRNR